MGRPDLFFGSLRAGPMLRDAGPTFKNSFVAGRDVIPAVSFSNARPCTVFPYGVGRRIVQNGRQQGRQRLRPADVEGQCGASRHLLVLRRSVVANHAPEPQGLDQGRVGPADLGGLDVDGRPGEQSADTPELYVTASTPEPWVPHACAVRSFRP